MESKSIILIITIFSLTIVFSLSSCRSDVEQTLTQSSIVTPMHTDGLPKPLPTVAIGVNDVLVIRWFEQPYSGKYYELTLGSDNRFIHSRIIINNAMQGVNRGQITENERREVASLLEMLRGHISDVPSDGHIIISMSFPWKGELQSMNFSETCPTELRRLFEIAETAFEREARPSNWIPCPK